MSHRPAGRVSSASLDGRSSGGQQPAVPASGARTAARLAAGVALLVLAVGVVTFGAYRPYAGNLHVTSIRTADLPGEAVGTAVRQNFLLVGLDTRDMPGGGLQAPPGSADTVIGQRSDTVMLVHLPADGAKVASVSVARDSYVQVPASGTAPGRSSSRTRPS